MQKQLDNYSNLYINLFSSCIGTLTAEVLTLPVCTIKTIYQNNKNLTIKSTIDSIIKSQGVKGLFTASSPAIITQILSTSSKFTIYEKIKHIRQTDSSSIIDNSINGIISGLTGSLLTHPFDVWKNFTQRNENYWAHINHLRKNNLFQFIKSGLYPGYSGSIGKNVALYSTLFPLNDFYKSKFDSIYISAPLTTLTVSLIVQPFDYYKVVKIAGNKPVQPFRGFSLMLARNIPHFTITMVLTDWINKYLFNLTQKIEQ
jgi:hypothetical protein